MKYLPLFMSLATSAAVAAARPNVLFCITDDQSFPHTSAYGTEWVRTAAFDRVAENGLLFMRAYTPNAKCAPSRAVALTGRNSWQLEAAGNHGAFYPSGYRTFMEALESDGYHTGFTGKGWAPGDPGEVDGRRRELTGRAWNNREAEPPTAAMSPIDYAANFAEFLDQKASGEPFCFWFGAMEPHRPYTPGTGRSLGGREVTDIDRVPAYWPDQEVVREDMLDYAFEIEHADRHLGQMLDLLEQRGELENTLVIVTSDNGMPFPRAKGATYELSHHVPFALMWSDRVEDPNRRVEAYTSFIDLAPTILEAAGLTPEAAGMEPATGRSLSQFFGSPEGAEPEDWNRLLIGQERHDVGRPDDVGFPVRGLFEDNFLYLRVFEPDRWPMGDPITGYLNSDGGPTKSLILEQNRQGVNHWMWELNFGRRPEEELYDLANDPDCIRNLALDPQHGQRLATMRETLFSELQAQGDPRMEGRGDLFDQYPYAAARVRNFYHRFVSGEEKPQARWVEDSDFEREDFDPERPLAGKP